MSLKENLELAKGAIRYLNKLGIKSVNVPFRLRSYEHSPWSRFDMFLFLYMRQETYTKAADFYLYRPEYRHWVEDCKRVRTRILQIIHSNASKSQKKKQLTQLMHETRFNPAEPKFRRSIYFDRTDCPDERRIRAARKAIKFGHGNCGEKSAIVSTWLLEKTRGTKVILWAGGGSFYDHAWTVMADSGTIDKQKFERQPMRLWDDSIVVVDGWTGDYYAAKHPFDPVKSGSFPNPFQLYVRRKVYYCHERGALTVNEEVNSWPPRFSPNFTLDKARMHNKEYEQPPPSLVGIVEDWDNVAEWLSPDDLAQTYASLS